MQLETLTPKTLAGIKSLAKKLKTRDGITHAAALEIAAKQAGFASYRHALTALVEDRA